MSNAHAYPSSGTIGERILSEIVKQGMVTVAHPKLSPEESIVFVWSANSAEQLDALVRNYISELKK